MIPPDSANFLRRAGPGCHIAHGDDWVIEWESVDPEDFGEDDVPDVAIDPEEATLSFCNVDEQYKIAYVTVFGTKLIDKKGSEMQQGTTNDGCSADIPCTTLIVLCPPTTFCHLCFIESPSSLKIESDVQAWKHHPNPADTASRSLAFPFGAEVGTLLCTQSENATLTHFFAGNYHALDFACPVGTPFVAVGDGVVHAVQTEHSKVSGIGVQNMFRWNSLMLCLDGPSESELVHPGDVSNEHAMYGSSPIYVEYVHIDSSCVKVGDVVHQGDVLGTTGAAGFCPSPHLHISAFRSSDDTAATCRVYFRGSAGALFLPQAGLFYNADGLVTIEEPTERLV